LVSAAVTRNSWPPTLTSVLAATLLFALRSVLVKRSLEPYDRVWMRPRLTL
jgi:hypothetical protein